jgi:hypothetical protein
MKVKTYRYEPGQGGARLTHGLLGAHASRAPEIPRTATGKPIMKPTSAPERSQLKRIAPPVLVLVVLCSAGLAGATPAVSGVPGQQATERDGQHDFDFIFGRWKIHLKRRRSSAGAAESWSEFEGYGVYRKIWDGRANLNEFEANSPDGHIEGLTLRTYNPKTRQWSLYWASSRDGILAEPQAGKFHDGVGEFYAFDTIDGKSVFVRYVWSKITASSVHFEQAFSADGGKTWDVNWISDMSREPEPPPNTSPTKQARRTGAAPPVQERTYDFDPLLGRWKYRLRRRTNPLTGSTNWVQFTGTGVCYKLWDGRAQLDTVLLNGASGAIEGLTLRLFDPQSRQWRLYWANSEDGTVAAPQIGQFTKEHGEFYAQDVLDDRSILIKFDWTQLNSASPHFEQSFSADGGKTWEVNWITDQTRQSAPR